MPDFVMTVRAIESDSFVAEVGDTSFLSIWSGDPSPLSVIPADQWYKTVRNAAIWHNDDGQERGDILFIVHGYNMSESEVMQRHRRLRSDLEAKGFKGVVVSFDWPSDDKTLAYLPDRHRAKQTALKLVSDGISYLSEQQSPNCTINVHVLGHSTGAYVIREAFDDADDTAVKNGGWSASQVIFAAGDVSANSMSTEDSGSDSVYRHCVRFTNYSSRHDEALDLSNVKRLGTAPRAGRVGLPDDIPANAVNIDCTSYYEVLTSDDDIMRRDSPTGIMGMKSHSWYFGNLKFTEDLFAVLVGKDRTVIPSREIGPDGNIRLKA